MASTKQAELRANEVIVRDFSKISEQQQQQWYPVEPHRQLNPSESPTLRIEQKQQADKPNSSTIATKAKDPPQPASTERHAKLTYTRFYSPHWTSQHQPPEDRILPPAKHTSSSGRNQSHGSGTSFGSQYSTMPHARQQGFEDCEPVERRRCSTIRGASRRRISMASGYSNDDSESEAC